MGQGACACARVCVRVCTSPSPDTTLHKVAGLVGAGALVGSVATYQLATGSTGNSGKGGGGVQCEERAAAGRCYLVGAGPGASDLLTLRAVHFLGQADVVIRDELMNPEILKHCRPDCEIIEQGKRGGREGSAKQVDINKVLVDRCARGQTVVRLKGGDPYVFGRAHQEIDALNAAG
jgi:hypothetical protein